MNSTADITHFKSSADIVTALVTPFDKQGKLNIFALREIVQYNLELGGRAFYLCGTTGESFSLSVKERQAIVEIVKDEISDQEILFVNVSHMEQQVVAELAEHAAQAGADAISLLPPLFFPLNAQEVTCYYQTLLDQVQLPATVYNIPSLSKIPLDESTVRELSSHPHFMGIKHSSEDTYLLNQFKKIDDGRLLVWSGRDAYYLGALAMGADGAIGSSFNLMADLFTALTTVYHRGDVKGARRIQELANEVHQRLGTYGAIGSIKACYSLLGIDAGTCRLPFQPLPVEAAGYLTSTLALLADVRCEVQKITVGHAELALS